MISFFRNIRQSSLMDHKTSKYLKYALGEIILVVLGILIALQVNNWNETRKNNALQRQILEQIKINLLEDKANLEGIKQNGLKAMASIDNILDKEITGKYPDSIKYWLGNVIQFDRFQPLTNAYEVLKSKGLDIIENKDLVFLLGRFYDDKATHIIKAVGDIENVFGDYWLEFLEKNMVSFKFKEFVELRDASIFQNDLEKMNFLKLTQDNYLGSTIYLNEGIQLIDQILIHIH